jgi:biopolymer transport protein ExbD
MHIALPQSRRKARIEIVPLIDIIFFLLATFVLVSMSMVKNQGVPIRLPVAVSSKPVDRGESMIIRIDKDGAVTLDKKPYPIDALNAPLTAFRSSKEDPKIVIQGDTDVAYGTVIAVLDAARRAGISKVAVQTAKTKS